MRGKFVKLGRDCGPHRHRDGPHTHPLGSRSRRGRGAPRASELQQEERITAALTVELAGFRSAERLADKFAGLDGEELKWRKEIIATDPLCKATAEDQKCQNFEVSCKAERTVTPPEAAKGVTAHVVVMMTWNGFDQKFKHPQSGTLAAQFTKSGSGWTRAAHGPVYVQTCADL